MLSRWLRASRLQHVFGVGIAQAQDGDLPAFAHDVAGSVGDDVQPLLVHQARHHAEQRSVGVLETQPGAHQFGVRLFAGQVIRLEVVREMRIAARVPRLVDAVDDAGQAPLGGDPPHQPLQAGAKGIGGDLARIGWTDGGHVVGIEQASLEERHAVVELDAVDVERAFGDAEFCIRSRSYRP